MLEIKSKAKDKVIDSTFFTALSNYDFAINKLYPLVNRFPAQRKTQDEKFYQRLKKDIIDGCLMPPLTIAFVDQDFSFKSNAQTESYILENISNAYILDGIQRLNTLKKAKQESGIDFPVNQDLYLNIIISRSEDKLLYRMITLNNGQKPMTPRHQIEVLTQELFDFSNLELKAQTEKERADGTIRGAFNLSDISKAYLAFLTKHVHNDNQKIIDEKMDEIIVGRIMDESRGEAAIEFKDILHLLDILCKNIDVKKWLKVNNNLIGFSAAIHFSYDNVQACPINKFADLLENFESAFSAVNPSKVNVGKYRRELAFDLIKNFRLYTTKDSAELTEIFADKIAN